MNRWKRIACLIFLTNLLFTLTACAPSLYSENEVLEILSERYGEEFAIMETLNSDLYPSITPSHFAVRSRLYSVALSNDPENVFWVRQEVIKYGGLFVAYGRGVDDTLTHDRFLTSFNSFLKENGIQSFFAVISEEGFEEKALEEHLAEPHLFDGTVYVSITEDKAEEIVTQIFDFTDSFYSEYSSKGELNDSHLAIKFYDESKMTKHELYKLYESYVSIPGFNPYSRYDEEASIDYVLKAINELYYGITNAEEGI